ncbi:MAG: carbon storage regulator [Varibaculum sp.]|nr:carbon storage regulator [Varibaculum sp.]
MLVLTRRKGEQILIGDDVLVTVVDIGRDMVRIGLDAPRSTRIKRGELVEEGEVPADKLNKTPAAQSSPTAVKSKKANNAVQFSN